MADTVKLIIDDVEYQVPAGANLVDAAKQCGVDIPVFCYHPKLGHDGNCRMCLVELALPRVNQQTGQTELAWFPTLQTACTQKVVDGMAIRTKSQKVIDGRREILEFLLSSHPLDCPVCDKGGECPLQNLTMRHGPGTSRMYWEDKMHLGKHIPLGEIIYLDQERCIHCARCIRFCDLIAEDHVLGFDQRGRKQQIITLSQPGFDSIFSGNTTDICPVGALTTADFRFNARPWEMVQVATICTHCPVGCNMSFDTRPDRDAGGRTTIKRVMPRQNERVNEIWICDKGRFAHHYMHHLERLTKPLIRRGGKLVEASWEEALSEAVAQLRSAGASIAALAGGRLSNEDLYSLQKLIRAQGSPHLAVYPPQVAGGELVAQVGVGVGTNFLDLGKGDAILVVASDLHEEAPVWWLRIIAAAKRGASLIVLNGRKTRLDRFATHTIHYVYGDEVATLNAMLGSIKPHPGREVAGLDETLKAAKLFKASKEIKAAAQVFAEANNAVILTGGEGLNAECSRALAQAAANLLIATGHTGRANNGLIVVWPSANGQGASDMGFNPDFGPGYQPVETVGLGYEGILKALADNQLKVLYIAGADPAFDDPAVEQSLCATKGFIIVQDMFLTKTAELADIVFPAQSAAEREGTYTSGERRVQRFYPAIEPLGESQPDWLIVQMIGEQLGHGKPAPSAAAILNEIGRTVPQYAGITYQALAKVEPQLPDVGGEDLYYGGTAFQNTRGLGVQWASAAEDAAGQLSMRPAVAENNLQPKGNDLIIVPVTRIYDTEPVFHKTALLHQRISAPYAALNPDDARRLGFEQGDTLGLTVGERTIALTAVIDASVPRGVALVPRRLQAQGAPLEAKTAPISKLEKIEA
jgi:NADH-quinone oxidoreductase subunit G